MPQLKAQEFHPTQANLRKATRESLDAAVSDEELDRFLDSVQSDKAPDPINADATLKIFGKGTLRCEVTDPEYSQWVYDHDAYGAAAAYAEATGFIYTAFTSWDSFFQKVTGFHVQGISSGGGILQINFFRDLVPMGQFNGVVKGVGLFEAGGNGKWEKK